MKRRQPLRPPLSRLPTTQYGSSSSSILKPEPREPLMLESRDTGRQIRSQPPALLGQRPRFPSAAQRCQGHPYQYLPLSTHLLDLTCVLEPHSDSLGLAGEPGGQCLRYAKVQKVLLVTSPGQDILDGPLLLVQRCLLLQGQAFLGQRLDLEGTFLPGP